MFENRFKLSIYSINIISSSIEFNFSFYFSQKLSLPKREKKKKEEKNLRRFSSYLKTRLKLGAI
ncbi:hypothetical protein ES288_D02G248800v1 [Gossypium darwinii]|uniref:Uncharacterized protein n=1 Tax=Gossypium darwinii TaxID=34276 RepID=A0A5D2DHH4_GOSDA|nr:hypothetical protein ES288_D02G248800v1 [Gossypium darwinii]